MGVEEDLERVEKEETIKDRFIEDDSSTTAERVKGLIEDCKKLLIPDLESVVGAWGLIDSDPVTGIVDHQNPNLLFENNENITSQY